MANQKRQIEKRQKESVKEWARNLVFTVSRAEAQGVLENYRAISVNPKVTKEGRKIAAERVSILEKLI